MKPLSSKLSLAATCVLPFPPPFLSLVELHQRPLTQLSSAGLDVFPSEPTINPLLLANDRLTLLPHMGTETVESQKKMEVLALDNVVRGLTTGRVRNGVWEQREKL